MAESHGWVQTAPFAWDGARGVLARVERLPSGPARVRVRERGGAVAVETDRRLPGADRVELGVRVARMLQLATDVAGFHAAVAYDPELRDELAARAAGRLLAGTTLYEDVVKAICATNTRWPLAVAALGRMAAWSADGAFPGPADLLDAGEDRLRAEARVGYRAAALLDAARAALDGRLDDIEREGRTLEGPALAERLARLRGVGPATAGVLCLLMGRHDLPVVDAATIRLAGRRWFGGERPTTAQILERVAPAGPWRGLALYWATLLEWRRETDLGPPPA